MGSFIFLCVGILSLFTNNRVEGSEIPLCEDNPIWGAENIEIPEMFASEWCATEGYWGCGIATLGAEDARNTANEDYQCNCDGANENCPVTVAGGWYIAPEDTNCNDACESNNLQCKNYYFYEHNVDVDSSDELVALIEQLGGTTEANECSVVHGYKGVAPFYRGTKCFHSDPSRSFSSFDCGATFSPAGTDKRRLCWCTGFIYTLRGVTGEEDVTILDGDVETNVVLGTENTQYGTTNSEIVITFNNDNGVRDVVFESDVIWNVALVPNENNSHFNAANCGSSNEDATRCSKLLSGNFNWGGTYTLEFYE